MTTSFCSFWGTNLCFNKQIHGKMHFLLRLDRRISLYLLFNMHIYSSFLLAKTPAKLYLQQNSELILEKLLQTVKSVAWANNKVLLCIFCTETW